MLRYVEKEEYCRLVFMDSCTALLIAGKGGISTQDEGYTFTFILKIE